MGQPVMQFQILARDPDKLTAFYGSDEWRQGPREAILALIESHVSVVLPAGSLSPDCV